MVPTLRNPGFPSFGALGRLPIINLPPSSLGGSAPSSLLTGLSFGYKFEDGAVGSWTGAAADVLGVNTLSATNSPATVSGKNGNARQFVRTNAQYLSAPDAAAFRFGTEFFVSLWFQTPAGYSDNPPVLSKDNTGSNRDWIFTMLGSTLKPTYVLWDDSGTLFELDWTGPISLNAWHNMQAGLKDGSMFLSIDGAVDVTLAFAGTPRHTVAPVNIGGRSSDSTWGDFTIDDVYGFSAVPGSTQRAALAAGATYPFTGIP